ncbi:uncharacterized protein LOC142325026 [Lycorma delicatula]|uniref:uncharacterized protein LOC142325026 n=1 Tax=Lycorma delicatula TaxID=130591 RepID=UPI003F50EF8A
MDEISENSIQQDYFASWGPCTSSGNSFDLLSNESSNSAVNVEQEYLSGSDSIYDEFCFPRCEYKTRFKGTSAFPMDEKKYWGTYFRSTVSGGNSDRIAKLTKSDKTYSNTNINKSTGQNKQTVSTAKIGTVKSPWIHNEYKKIFNREFELKELKINRHSGILLYDQLLQYKAHICTTVINSFSALEITDKKIDVYFENDYPCILVQIKKFAAQLEPEKEQASLYNIVIAYFTAITNKIAKDYNIPVELVNRSSFGHNIPSVAATAKNFRINIGIVPKVYASKVLANSLKLLNNEFLVPLLSSDTTKTLKLGFTPDEIKTHNSDVTNYNLIKINKRNSSRRQPLQVERWNENEDLFIVLCKVGDSSGRKVSFQITRCKAYIDLLTDYVTEHLQTSNTCPSNLLFTKPLMDILKKLTYKSIVTLEIKKDDYHNKKLKFSDEEDPNIKGDDKFWKTIQDISSIFELLDINTLSSSINSKKINGLYSMLERGNLEFIKNSNIQQSEEGYGSDSDCEVSVEDTTFYSRKITVSTGMRAINLAHFLLLLFRSKNIDVDYMYYEVADVLKNLVCNISDSYFFSQTSTKLVDNIFDSFFLSQSPTEVKLKYIDLNHCAAYPNNKVDLIEIQQDLYFVQAILLDYTSATTAKISEAISLFIPKVPLLLLVNSGIKNEQIGADMNPYGTLRIIATDRKNLNKMYYILKAHLIVAENLPSESHNIRKAYKTVGAVVKSADIYKKERGYHYKPNTNKNDNSEYSYIEAIKLPDKMKKIVTLFSSKYEDRTNNLIKYKSLDEILHWDFNKIYFLGSNNVSETLQRNAYYLDETVSELFEELETSYNTADDYGKRKIVLSYFYDEVFMLTTEYDKSEEEMLDWDLDKVEFLSSNEVFHLLNNLWPNDIKDNFNEIEFSYDNNKNFTINIVNIILKVDIENYQSTELNFNELTELYKKEKKKENFLNRIDDKDIMEKILFDDTYDEEHERAGRGMLSDSVFSTPRSNSCESMYNENNSIYNSNSHDDSNQSSNEAMDYENN